MVLVDTSVWIDHLHHGDPRLVQLLEDGEALQHPLVVGELACGSMRNRATIISLLQELPSAPSIDHDESLELIEKRKLFGLGLGYIGVQILGSSMVSQAALWSRDKTLKKIAEDLGIHFED